MSTDTLSFAETAQSIQDWIVGHRRHLHRHPELSFHEEKTSAYLAEQVRSLGLAPVPVKAGRFGFYADLAAPAAPGRFIALRADMDALPIQEETGLPFSSENPGVGHLCGHDSHSSMLLGAARMLVERRAELPRSVRFFFQHAEEILPGGAIDFVESGAMAGVEHVFGLHVRPNMPIGQFSVFPGPTMASATEVKITVRGKGGHAAAPHDAVDPVLGAAAVVMAAQQVVSRRTDPFDTAVVSLCQIKGGSAHNVIPSEVSILGTTRGFDMEKLRKVNRHLEQTARAAAQAYGCEAEVVIEEGYPPVMNDPDASRMLIAAAQSVLGAENVRTDFRSMGGEDFAYFCLAVPSAFGFLGVMQGESCPYSLHHPKFHPAEDAFWRGAAILAQSVYAAAEADGSA
ncbi:MAG: M20 family metallopeptidase [Candidatus Sumerlaeia bacterium]|nr:M20 family metallopeptidase [Candidatus Sumerlaeia bacterium]